MRVVAALVAAAAVVWAASVAWQYVPRTPPAWTAGEVEVLRSIALRSLPPLPAPRDNAVADNPEAARFGEALFFDSRLSVNGGISCATCHQPERRFTDGLARGQAIGTTDRHTPSIVGSAYSPWQFWDGRSDSLWAQALQPLEDANEHGLDRREVVQRVAEDSTYRAQYQALFDAAPPGIAAESPALDRAFANIGKAIAAYERTLLPLPSRFDDYVDAVLAGDKDAQRALFSTDEIWGLRLFIGEANCLQCHNGPLLTNHEFHNTGVISFPGHVPDKARAGAVQSLLQSPFNCRGPFGDDPEPRCDELEFMRTGTDLLGAFKTPSLRNLKDTAPFMHKGQLANLAEVLLHYNEAPDAMIGHNEAKPLGLNGRELRQLEWFLLTLDGGVSGF